MSFNQKTISIGPIRRRLTTLDIYAYRAHFARSGNPAEIKEKELAYKNKQSELARYILNLQLEIFELKEQLSMAYAGEKEKV